ncbi:MAG: cytochrome d ubiquinol oxidase subunit II [Pseudobdellovibrionaceae bacterium]
MFSFESFLNLPLIWGGLIAVAILIYVILDGFDLGVGILFPFAPSDKCRDRAMNSIAPFWDGNETWLVLGGGGLFAAFPLAYAILMPALYIPIIAMLLCLIFRGVAFEFRFKAEGRSRRIWDYSFHFGSLGTAFFQGLMLGAFVQGIEVEGREFSGGAFDWLTSFSMMTGLGVVVGYALIGATWLHMKTEDKTKEWAAYCAKYLLLFVALFMGLVCLWVPFLNNDIWQRWFTAPFIYYVWPIPLLTLTAFTFLVKGLYNDREILPFLMSIALFVLGYIGLALSLWPHIVPFQVTVFQAAAAPTSLSLLLIGAVIALPAILGYTAYCYYLFRGKASHEHFY